MPIYRDPVFCLPAAGRHMRRFGGVKITGQAKSPSFREHEVTHLCVVLYLHAVHEYNLISAPITGHGMETKRRKVFLARNVLVND